MEAVLSAIGNVLGIIMKGCYRICPNYGIAILLFTLASKVIFLPLSLWIQKNSIKMVKMTPMLENLKLEYADDEDAFIDAQTALYKQEKYSPLAGIFPLLLQIPLILGLIDVVYKPLKHLLSISESSINAIIESVKNVTGLTDLGSSPQLFAVDAIQNTANFSSFSSLDASFVERIQGLNLHFLGLNLGSVPKSLDPVSLLWIPVLAAVSAFLLCVVQNKANVLQIEQSALSQWGMTAFLVLFSLYFAFMVPAGIGLYWIYGNLLSIAVIFFCNAVYDPKKYIDYDWLEQTKAAAKAKKERAKENAKRAKADYERFFANGNAEKMRLVVFMENKGLYKYIRNVIEEVIRRSDIPIHYIAADFDDPMLTEHDPQIIPYYADEKRLIPMMMRLECDMVIMTTPDLDQLYIKRSKYRKDIEYVFIDHACTNMSMGYRTDALAAFDTVFICSPILVDELRALEELRHTKKKMLVKCGYGLIDNMIADYEKKEKRSEPKEKKQIMIAPSHQKDNLLDSCIDNILGSLLGKGWRVILRPHPQYLKRYPSKWKAFLGRYAERIGEDFMIDTDYTSSESVFMSDILITDWSGIPYEFSFTTLKPSLFVNTEMKVLFPDWEKLGVIPYDITGRNKIGKSIEKEDTPHIADTVEYLLEHTEDYRGKLKAERESYFYNLGRSGEVGAKYILSRLDRK